MRVTVEQLAPFGADGGLVHFVDTAFFNKAPDRVGVAVSGGGDSMALLHVAKCWSDLTGVPIEAVTVNHGLRDEAADEAAMVAAFCADRDIPHEVLRWDGQTASGNIAAAGREARYRLIADWAKMRGIGGVLLGHTVDDIAETFLMRLARKSGVDGLSMMDVRFERHGIHWARPFWQQEREELRDYLRRHGVPWVDDPTNEDESYDRPKARKALAALAPLGITTDVLKSVAMNMSKSRSALEAITCDRAEQATRMEAGDVVIDTFSRPPVPYDIQHRILVGALKYVGGKAHGPRHGALLELEVALSQVGKHTLAGCVVTKEDRCWRVAREHNAVRDLIAPTDAIWDKRWQLSGPHAPELTIRALGEAIKSVPDWRDTGLPRTSLLATPAVFDGDTLIAAPVAGLQNGWTARIVADFATFLLSR